MDEKMIQTKCRNGHYFDREEFIYCPICGSEAIDAQKSIIVKHKKGLFRNKKCQNGHTLDSYDYNICPIGGAKSIEKMHILKVRKKFADIDFLVLETYGHHIELNISKKVLRYKNVISPSQSTQTFPEGYFEENTTIIEEDDFNRISNLFDLIFQMVLFTNQLEACKGKIESTYLRIECKGISLYYAGMDKSRFLFRKEKFKTEKYISLVRLLESKCDFPEYFGVPIKYPNQVTERLNCTDVLQSYVKMIGYRYSETGIWGYYFLKDKVEFCSISSIISPTYNAMICCNNKKWDSTMERETIFPGLTRYINDAKGKIIHSVIYRNTGIYQIDSLTTVYCDETHYKFYCDNKLVAEIKRYIGENTSMKVSGFLAKPFFEVTFEKEIKEDLLILICSFPVLRFGL